MLRRYLSDLLSEMVLRIFVVVDVVGLVTLILLPETPTLLPPAVWAVAVAALGFGWANYRLYRRYAPVSPVGRARSLLASAYEGDRMAAINDLAAIGTPLALRELRRALGHEYPDVRDRTALRLAERDDPEAVPNLKTLLRSNRADPEDRAAAARHLGRLAPQASLPDFGEVALGQSGGGDLVELRLAVIELLARHGGDQAVTPLRSLLADSDVNEEAVDALTRIGTPAAIDVLAAAYDETSEASRERTAGWPALLLNSLVRLGEPGWSELLRRHEDQLVRAAFRDLVPAEGLAWVLDRAEVRGDPDLARRFIWLLDDKPDGKALLARIVRDGDGELRRIAAQTLAGSQEGRVELARLIDGEGDDVAGAVLKVLSAGQRGEWSDELVDALRRRLGRGPLEIRRLAVLALGWMAELELKEPGRHRGLTKSRPETDPKVPRDLLALVSDPSEDPELRRVAVLSLARMCWGAGFHCSRATTWRCPT
jgi:HEAT repeat protein